MKHEFFFDEAGRELSPFYKSFISLCKAINKSPSAVAKEAGISSGAPTAWKGGAVPKQAQREKLCAYFSVSENQILGYDDIKKPTPVSEGGQIPNYELLSPENRVMINELIAKLLASQSDVVQ